jgi:hypothetical protein
MSTAYCATGILRRVEIYNLFLKILSSDMATPRHISDEGMINSEAIVHGGVAQSIAEDARIGSVRRFFHICSQIAERARCVGRITVIASPSYW